MPCYRQYRQILEADIMNWGVERLCTPFTWLTGEWWHCQPLKCAIISIIGNIAAHAIGLIARIIFMWDLWNHSSPTFPIPGQSLIVTDCWTLRAFEGQILTLKAFEGQILINVWPIQPIRVATASTRSTFLPCWTVILCTCPTTILINNTSTITLQN